MKGRQEGSVSLSSCLAGIFAWILLAGTVPSPSLIGIWTTLCILIYISISDIRRRLIPNRAILALAGVWFCQTVISAAAAENMRLLLRRLLSGSCAALLLAGSVALISELAAKALKKLPLGGGDIKLIGAAGLFLGFEKSLDMLFLSCLFGLLTALLCYRQRRIPFGPAIAAAFMIHLLQS